MYSFVPMIAQPRKDALYGNGAGLSFAPVHKNIDYVFFVQEVIFFLQSPVFSGLIPPHSDVKVLQQFLCMKSRKLICDKYNTKNSK